MKTKNSNTATSLGMTICILGQPASAVTGAMERLKIEPVAFNNGLTWIDDSDIEKLQEFFEKAKR